jgi:uncharacterized protein YjdB
VAPGIALALPARRSGPPVRHGGGQSSRGRYSETLEKKIMKRRFITWLGGALAFATMALAGGQARAQDICYQGHVQGWGDVAPVCDGVRLGSTGQSRRLEAVMILPPSTGGQICFQAFVQDLRWGPIICDATAWPNQLVGTRGLSKRMEALVIWHNNPPMGHQLQYRGHVSNFQWQGPLTSGTPIGNDEQRLRIEALEVNIVRPGDGPTFWQ